MNDFLFDETDFQDPMDTNDSDIDLVDFEAHMRDIDYVTYPIKAWYDQHDYDDVPF